MALRPTKGENNQLKVFGLIGNWHTWFGGEFEDSVP